MSQGGIIAISIIRVLLLLALLLALMIIFAERVQLNELLVGLKAGAGLGIGTRYPRRRRHANDKTYAEESSHGGGFRI